MGMGGTRPGGEGGPLGMSAKGSVGVGWAGGLFKQGPKIRAQHPRVDRPDSQVVEPGAEALWTGEQRAASWGARFGGLEGSAQPGRHPLFSHSEGKEVERSPS